MKKYIYLFCSVLTILWIWGNSLQDAPHSSTESQWVLDWVRSSFSMVPGMDRLSMYAIRKAAHLTEYMALGFFLSLVSMIIWKKNKISWITFLGALIAIMDECIQLFSPGRSSQVSDVMIDTVGVFLGTLLVWVWRKI